MIMFYQISIEVKKSTDVGRKGPRAETNSSEISGQIVTTWEHAKLHFFNFITIRISYLYVVCS